MPKYFSYLKNIPLGTFKYHMMLQGGRGFAQTVIVPSYGEEGVGQIVITFIVVEKA